MRFLSVLKRRITIFLRISWNDKKLLLEVLFLTALTRIIILLIPFNKYQKSLGTYGKETPYRTNTCDYEIIKKVSWAVNTISLHTPWESKCLVQAMTAQIMLKRHSLGSTLYLGLSKDSENNMVAHAWLRCGQVLVTGGYNINAFKEVARFANVVSC